MKKQNVILSSLIVIAAFAFEACGKKKSGGRVPPESPESHESVRSPDTVSTATETVVPAPPAPPPAETPAPLVNAPVDPAILPAEVPRDDSVEVPANAVKKGAFTFFTVPQSPAAGEDYVLYMKASFPTSVGTYEASDLFVYIRGQDGYEVFFTESMAYSWERLSPLYRYEAEAGDKVGVHPFDSSVAVLKFEKLSHFKVVGTEQKEAILAIHMPGGPSPLSQTVTVRSLLLNQSQTVSLRF